jgi:hypothetical protein
MMWQNFSNIIKRMMMKKWSFSRSVSQNYDVTKFLKLLVGSNITNSVSQNPFIALPEYTRTGSVIKQCAKKKNEIYCREIIPKLMCIQFPTAHLEIFSVLTIDKYWLLLISTIQIMPNCYAFMIYQSSHNIR